MYGRGSIKVLKGAVELRMRPLLAYVCMLMLMTIYECDFLCIHIVTCIFIIKNVHVLLDFIGKKLFI